MRVLFDTSTLLSAFLQGEDNHARALAWLKRVRNQEIEGVVSTHSLAELYSTLTGKKKYSATAALLVIEQDIIGLLEKIDLSAADYHAVLTHFESLDILGGTVYDGLISLAAKKANVDFLVTGNKSHFDRIAILPADKIVEP